VSVGRFITLEGIEGAGKSTVAKYVADWLTGQGIAVRLTREPGGTPLAERVRGIVLERGTEEVSAVTETLLMFAARALHVENVIDPALIDTLAHAVHPHLAPDCTLLLDLPVAAGLSRARKRGGAGADRFEAETVSFFEKVRAGYLTLARREPARIHVIDAAGPLREVLEQVAGVLARLPQP